MVVADLTARMKGLRVAAARHARLADPANLHLTLAFLGEVPDDRLPDVKHALASAARTARSPRLCLAGGGCFGEGRSTVLWVDVRGDVEALDALALSIRDGLREAGAGDTRAGEQAAAADVAEQRSGRGLVVRHGGLLSVVLGLGRQRTPAARRPGVAPVAGVRRAGGGPASLPLAQALLPGTTDRRRLLP